MQKSLEILKQANITPRLQLGNKTDKGVVSTGPHKVKFLADKETDGVDVNGKPITVIAYLVEENGVKKSYRVPKFGKNGEIHYLVIRLANINEGEEVVLEMKKRGIKNYIEVSSLKDTDSHEVEEDDGIPVINSNNEDEQIID